MINCETDSIPEVAQALADLPGVSEVYSTAGHVDLIAIVRVPRLEADRRGHRGQHQQGARGRSRPRPTSPSAPTPGTTWKPPSRSASKRTNSRSRPLLAGTRSVSPRLLTIAADVHGAPAARAIARPVHEGLGAVVAGADLDPAPGALGRRPRDPRHDLRQRAGDAVLARHQRHRAVRPQLDDQRHPFELLVQPGVRLGREPVVVRAR